MKSMRYCIIQCTWGCMQTLLGCIIYLINRKHKHYKFFTCITTEWNRKYGISLGLFIFIPADCTAKKEVLTHELGHSMQSLYLGPLYLVPGLCSVLWAMHPCLVRYRRKHHISYHAFWTEKWADLLGEKAVKRF